MATVPNITNANRVVDYTATAAQDEFAITWPVIADSELLAVNDLVVNVDGTELAAADFSFSGTAITGLSGIWNGGTVTLDTPLAGGERVIIYSKRDPRRTGYFLEGKALPMTELDKLLNDVFVQMRDMRFSLDRAIKVTAAEYLDGSGDDDFVGTITAATVAAQAVLDDLEEIEARIIAEGILTPGISYGVNAVSIDVGYEFGINVAAPEAPLHVGAGSLASEADPGIGLARAITGSSGTNCHGYVDVSTIDRGGVIGYAAYDAWSKFIGTSNYDHMAGYQARIAHQGNGTVTNMYCSYLTGTILTPASGSPGTVTNGYGMYIAGFTAGFGTLPNSYGVYVAAINSASTLNYSMYLDGTGTDGTVRMCPRVGVGTADAAVNRQFTVTTALSVGGWNSNIWAIASQFPSIRLFATTGDKWSGIGNNDDGSLQILVGASTGTGSPTIAAAFGAAGGLLMTGATGGNKGAGTINATAVYDDNVLLTDYVFDLHLDGKLRQEDEKSPAAKAFRPVSATALDLKSYTDFWRTNRHLPGFVTRKKWNAKSAPSVGKLAQQLWEGHEIHAIHLAALAERIAYLEQPWWRRLLSKVAP